MWVGVDFFRVWGIACRVEGMHRVVKVYTYIYVYVYT